jgi:amino acid permease
MPAAEPRETDPLLSQETDNEGRDPDGQTDKLHRALSARQVTTIALGGAIGTGLFLGTGRSLAAGGPGTMLICYGITGFIVCVGPRELGRPLIHGCTDISHCFC